ncbi:permease [Candidatus Solincola tengchongensis]|uniref:permease n=1 Tax=Candidatus Solincola tengchongensis TaxID=2900693 RepID=UPI00257F33F7|nr:permease [Candidatus Solincola tengchongensis]
MRKNDDARAEGKWQSLRERIRWDYAALFLIASLFTVMVIALPEKGAQARHVAWEYFKEMAMILPAVFIIMGLVSVWVEREFIIRFLGEGSGVKGVALSFILGSIPMGPLYVAFPLTLMLLKKGAKVANMIIFLSAWACIKLPAELMELQFLGWKFTLVRYLATLLVVVVLSEVIGRVFFKEGYKAPDEALGGAQT